ncbi:MAG: DUF2254 domain-containing protein [Gemmataceae bacterium]
MTWLQRYRIRHYIATSIWIMPSLLMVVAMAMTRLCYWIDRQAGWESAIHAETARAVLATMAASMFTFIVFVSSALLVAVQLASAQLTPRIIAIVFRSPVTRFSLSLFVFTFTFSLAALVRITESVPSLTVQVAAYSSLVSLVIFLFLIDHVGKFLRPSGALRSVAELGRSVIKTVYPHALHDQKTTGSVVPPILGEKPRLTVTKHQDGVVLAFDVAGLVAMAQRADCIIEVLPQVGDHITVGDQVFRVFGGTTSLSEKELGQSIAVGLERTLTQDPTFAFRIMVDIASKGLSPAINDPTTAVLAIDQIHHLLQYVGTRDLDTGVVHDANGRLRLIYRTPDWEDFVRLAVTEIRQFGDGSIQIARRLRGMLENLIQTLPDSRAALLREELAILKRSAERVFTEPEDRALAEVSDAQGVGGKRSRT